MLLAIDIGNTNIVAGCFEGGELKHEFRFKTDAARPLDEYAGLFYSLLDRRFQKSWKVTGCIISSVVPVLTPLFRKLAQEQLGTEALVIDSKNAGIALNYKEPATVGADRLANAIAVRKLYGAPALVVDFGTATTFDLVGSEGAYEGGIIAAGFSGSLDALVRNTALLPRIEMKWPESAIGRSTISCMQAGIVRGYVCMVDGLIEMIQAEAGVIPFLVATGGLGKLITDHSQRLKIYDKYLTIKGMLFIAQQHGIA